MPQLFRKTPTGYEPVSVDPSSPTTKDNDAPAAAQLPSSVFQFIKIIGVFLLLVFVSVVLMGTGALNSSTVTAILDDIGNSNSNSNNNNNGNNNNDNNNDNGFAEMQRIQQSLASERRGRKGGETSMKKRRR